ncbi:MAG: Ig-like domain-containing protein [Candidatus Methanoplasma sp.]|jgi:uncharacterized protein YjdB|nr:Ig-like domain-containing protein [Candidatus Methanoplasma sp.]
MNAKGIIAIIAVFAMISVPLYMASDDSDAASYSANVFTDAGGSQKGYTGSGATVRDIVESALAPDHTITVDGVGRITAVDGATAPEGMAWIVFQWMPLQGWTVRPLNNDANGYLDTGTSYYVTLSEKTADGLNTIYSKPTYEPAAQAYFFIKFITDVNAPSVLGIMNESRRSEGFWITGTGSDAAEAFSDACTRYALPLNMNLIDGNEQKGWLGSFVGLQDDRSSGDWNNWSQFHWANGTWIYSDCLGHYDPGVVKYYAIVRQITVEDRASDNTGIVPSSDINVLSPSDLSSGGTVAASSISINPNTVSLTPGSAYTLGVTFNPTATTNKSVTWSSSDTSVATIDGAGKITAKSEGKTTITAVSASGGRTAACTVTVSSSAAPTEPAPADGQTPADTTVWLNHESVNIDINDTLSLGAQIYPTTLTVSWSSSDDSVATVSDGKVTPVSPGTAVITVTTSDGKASADCSVIILAAGISQDPDRNGMLIAGIAVAVIAVLAVALIVVRLHAKP